MTCLATSNFGLRKALFVLLCTPLLLLMTLSTHAQALSDPCTSPTVGPGAGTVNHTTGCGALITVLAVDGNGNATAFSVATTGAPFDSGKEDVLVGIINNSSGLLTAITLSTPAGAPRGVFAFDSDGPCHYNSKDCFKSNGKTGYEGPANTFSNDSGKTSGTVNFNTSVYGPIPAGGSTWFALEGLPQTNVVQQVAALVTTGTNTSTFTTPQGVIKQDLIFPTNIINNNNSNQLTTTNLPVSAATWPEYVVGTPWAVSQCMVHLGNGGTSLCSLYVNACWNSATQTLAQASDALCPSVDTSAGAGVITIQDTFDTTKVPIPNGTTISLIAFTPPSTNLSLQWTPTTSGASSVCTNFLAGPCYIIDTLVDVSGDQVESKGTKPKQTKSWNVSAAFVPEPLTSVFAQPPAPGTNPTDGSSPCALPSPAALNDPNPSSGTYESPTFTSSQWFNGNCLVDFQVNQAQIPSTIQIPPNNYPPNNNYVSAPVAQFTYGQGANAGDGDVTLTNAPASAFWETLPLLNGLTLRGLLGGDGSGKNLHWGSSDIAGISERNIQLTPAVNNTCQTPDGPESGPDVTQCYNTNPYTVQVNVDSFAPQLGSCGTPDGTWHNSNVTLTCSASDVTSGIGTAIPAAITPTPVGAGMPLSFGMTTIVPVGTETSNAIAYAGAVPPSAPLNGGEQLCDLANNCAVFPAIGGNKIDEKAPVITVTAPTPGQTFQAYSSASSSVTCADGGSGVANCAGTPENNVSTATINSPLDTTPNGPGLTAKTFAAVNSVDMVGNVSSSSSINYNVSCHYASAQLNSNVIPKGMSFQPAATMLTDCIPTTIKTVITVSLTGPFGASCSTSTQLLFLPLPVTIPAGTNKSPLKGVLLLVPKNACSGGSFTFNTNTYDSSGKVLLDSVSQAVTVQ